jgi:hypothetical protein
MAELGKVLVTLPAEYGTGGYSFQDPEGACKLEFHVEPLGFGVLAVKHSEARNQPMGYVTFEDQSHIQTQEISPINPVQRPGQVIRDVEQTTRLIHLAARIGLSKVS